MEHYVTLFDIGFAPQGIALHRSLQRHAGTHTLWVVCMDQAVEELLGKLDLPDVRTIAVADAESDELLRVRSERSRAEYCWTLTPFTFDLVLERAPDAHRVTYVDADVWLRDDPHQIFTDFERSGAAVQITEHAYAPEHDQTATSGRYCVQFLTMDRDRSIPVRKWWQERCVEWCFARVEDGKFGDQKYLDDWPERFGNLVHVAAPKSRFQGPWNATRYPYSEASTYHFHGMRLVGQNSVFPVSPGYSIPRPHWSNVYRPYFDDLGAAVELFAQANGQPPEAQISPKATVRKVAGASKFINVFRELRQPPNARTIGTVVPLPRPDR
jgi:hypothetical protein